MLSRNLQYRLKNGIANTSLYFPVILMLMHPKISILEKLLVFYAVIQLKHCRIKSY